MLKPRWWDVAVGAGTVVIAVALLFGFGPDSSTGTAIGLSAIALFGLGYLLVGRAAIGRPPPGWRYPVFLIVTALALVVGAGAAPFVAMLQALAYPLTWVIGDTRRRGILGSIVIAVSAGLGIWVGNGLTAASAISGVVAAAFTVAFATALGLWITSIGEYGAERARLVAELTAAQAEVVSLSRDRGASDERERLARDVHDTLAQTLAGLAILSERAGRQLSEGRADAAADSIATVERLARDALDEARAIVSRMAAVPSDAALGDAVDRLVSRFRAETGLTIDLDLQLESPGVLSRESQLVLLRCLQESLATARKHAAATRIDVRVSTGLDGDAQLAVVDDGRGFDVTARRNGFGLEGMAERVALAGGELDVSSILERGTTLVVRLPATSAGQAVAR